MTKAQTFKDFGFGVEESLLFLAVFGVEVLRWIKNWDQNRDRSQGYETNSRGGPYIWGNVGVNTHSVDQLVYTMYIPGHVTLGQAI